MIKVSAVSAESVNERDECDDDELPLIANENRMNELIHSILHCFLIGKCIQRISNSSGAQFQNPNRTEDDDETEFIRQLSRFSNSP